MNELDTIPRPVVDDCPLKRSLFAALERILDESLGGVLPENCVFEADEQTIRDLERTEEIQTYWKSNYFLREAHARPGSSYYGFRVQTYRNYTMTADGLKRTTTQRKRFARLIGKINGAGYPYLFSVDVVIPGIVE